METIKCDRCKETIKPGHGESYLLSNKGVSRCFYGLSLWPLRNDTDFPKTMDLCGKCAVEFSRFLSPFLSSGSTPSDNTPYTNTEKKEK